MSIPAGIYYQLIGNAELVSMLSSYGTYPAVFTQEPIPEDAPKFIKYVVIGKNLSSVPRDTKVTKGRLIRRDIRGYCSRYQPASFYAPYLDPESFIENLGELIRRILHDATEMYFSGYKTVSAQVAAGPYEVPTDDTMEGIGLELVLDLETY